MFLPHTNKWTTELTGKIQADGEQIIDVRKAHYLGRWELQFTMASVPAAGTMKVSARMPGANGFADLSPLVDLVAGPFVHYFTVTAEEIKLTPIGLTAGVEYSVVIVGS